MGAVKIRPADKAFSDCVRERAGWKCERCGSYFEPGRRMGLHCSHFHGRGKWSTRFDGDNCQALCYGCHMQMGSHPDEHRRLMMEKLGPGGYDLLLERSNDTRIGRRVKREEAEIKKHYRAELRRMQALRANGALGRIEFDGWA